MKKSRLSYYVNSIALVLLFSVASCTEDDAIKEPETPVVIEPKEYDVYVVGVEKPDDPLMPYIAKYWKNGQVHALTDGTKSASANSIFINGDDVYIGGEEYNSKQNSFALYWKNGQRVHLTDSAGMSTARIEKILVHNGDVYAAGLYTEDGLTHAVYWKNGELVKLSSSKTYSNALDIAIDGTDVHVVGVETDDMNRGFARYWKNGKMTTLSGANVATGIEIDNGDVYICGYTTNTSGKYWKNGISIPLQNSYSTSDIQVYDGDVYVAGPGWNWKNGEPTPIMQGKNQASVTSIFVIDGDVYNTTWVSKNSRYVAQYRKNGTAVDLTDGTRFALALDIFVVEK